MKKIYTLAIISLFAISASAQRSCDLQMIQYIPSNTTILADADNPRSYIFTYGFKNVGTDAVANTDSIFFRTPYNTFYFRPSSGIPVGDTVYVRDTVQITPGSAQTTSNENPNFQWCDSLWIRGATPVVDPTVGNDKSCTTVKAVFWVTGINNVTYNNGIALYPNPANTQVSIKHTFTGNSNGYLAVRDITGKLVYKMQLGDNLSGEKVFTIDVTQFSAGLHIVELVTDGQKFVTKFSVQ